MKKLLAVILTCMLALSCTLALAETDFSAMSDDELTQLISDAQAELASRKAAEDSAALESEGMVSVKEAGFQVAGKWAFYSFVAHNNMSDKAIRYPQFRITLRDADGGMISVKEQTMSVLYPNQDIMYANQHSDVEGETVASIDVEFIEPRDYNLVDPKTLDYPEYVPLEVESAKLKESKSRPTIVGEFSNPNDFDIDRVAVTVFFRDENGQLLGGNTSYVSGVKAGTTTPFEVSVNKELPTDNYEVFVQLW